MQTLTGRQLCLRLMKYIAPYWDALTVALTCMIAMAATMPMLAALVLSMMDGVITGKNLELMQLILLGIIGIFTVRGVAGHIGAYTINWLGNKLVMDLRMKMFDKLLALPVRYCDGHAEYDSVSGITSGTGQLARTFTGLVTVMVKDTFTILGLLGWMFYVDWEFSLLALLIISVAVLILRLIMKRLRAMELKAGQITDGLSRVLKDSVENQWVVKLHGGEKYEHERMKEQAGEVSRLVMKQIAMASLHVPLIQITTAVSLGTIVYIAAQQASADEITAGGFASLVAAMLMLIAPVKRVAGVKEALHLGLANAERVFWLLDQETEPDTGTISIERARGELKLEQVSFHHHRHGREKNSETDPKVDPKAGSEAHLEHGAASCFVLRDVTLTIQPGEKVALVGLRGSTVALARLVARFVNPSSGRILLDGHDLKNLRLASLRANISFVSADTAIFNDTIAANIAYGVMSRATEGMVTAAALSAHASEFIRQMPEGLQTLVGEQGVNLDGGQRLRIAIARALLKNSPVLLLDEAFETMDSEPMHHVEAALDAVMEGRTTLVIAHRLATVEKADRVVLLDHGRIVESGSHQELLARRGAYPAFARRLLEPGDGR
ncbi:ABC transporter transmembrane domain-containing protein [Nitrosospira briensis]|uniref:ABC transporter transmembrane domain-containing protein n=1 Tax=Nitrosospira briensis TaxID=35799 RepID=UPI0009455A7E|nr:ABC transporter transmembrane domain-containing protein [Nitrosospira briensis]